ncbi:hypothetical protein R9B83_01130 [Metamycoplasma equirhinis]|uniref:Uncharacterized protein n=1 Tax=Metamycoplasma equirhinis TaxID=92402 RepID=A0ABZ0PAV2_9BACT|nr:hypothetical protein [Metamycoplasma equirhinis]TPD97764.1 hypothetical protein FJM08_03000 [Metamycoplasma equirhinis]WPB54158.1 hypothetical protein R9B83_01130 [Metamycoplasma equirhinis]
MSDKTQIGLTDDSNNAIQKLLKTKYFERGNEIAIFGLVYAIKNELFSENNRAKKTTWHDSAIMKLIKDKNIKIDLLTKIYQVIYPNDNDVKDKIVRITENLINNGLEDIYIKYLKDNTNPNIYLTEIIGDNE